MADGKKRSVGKGAAGRAKGAPPGGAARRPKGAARIKKPRPKPQGGSGRIESERLYKSLVDTAQELIWRCDESGRFTFLNPAWEAALGHRIDEMLGRPFTDFQRPEVAERDIKEFERLLAGGSVKGYETTSVAKTGKEVNLLFNAIPLYNSRGKIVGVQGTAIDVTWVREAEGRLKEQRRLLRKLLDERTLDVRIKGAALATAPFGVAFTDERGVINYVNKSFLEMWGYGDKSEVLGKRPPETMADPEETIEVMGALERDGVWNGVLVARRKDGSDFHVDVAANLVRGEDGSVASMMGTFEDVTERVRQEELLREQKAYYENLVRTANLIVIVLDGGGRVRSINDTACRILGYNEEELLGHDLFELLVPRERYPYVWREFAEFQRTNSIPAEFENPILTKDGVERIVSWRNSVIGSGAEVRTVSFGMDVTETRRVQEKLLKLTARYEFITRTTTDGFWLVDDKGRITDVNKSYCRISGYSREELIGMPISVVEAVETPEETARHVVRIMETGADLFETKHRRKDGSIAEIEVNTTFSRDERCFIAFVRDITERKRAEAELKRLAAQAEADSRVKSDLLNEVNHRVKNNLIAIQGLLLAEKRYCPEESRAHVMHVIDGLLNRVGGLVEVHQMLSEQRWTPVPMNALARRIVTRVVNAQSRDSSGVAVETGGEEVSVSPRQAGNLALIISELATNTFKYGRAAQRALRIRLDSSISGGEIVMTYADNGPGYPPEVLDGTRKGVGMEIVEKLAAATLRGSVEFSNDGGAKARVAMAVEETDRT